MAGVSCNLEVELKFEFTRKDLRKLSHTSAFKSLQVEKPVKKTLRAIYFDTPDLDLVQRNISLRIRKESRVYVQCCKSKASSPLTRADSFARQEWQWAIPDANLDVDLLLQDDELSKLLRGVDLKKLSPLFSTSIKRQTRLLKTSGGAMIRCDIDQGFVQSDHQKAPVFELELELESGPACELLSLAKLVTSIVPARLSSRTKAQRGLNLVLNGTVKNWVKATPLTFHKDATAHDVLCLSMMEEFKHLIGNEDCVLEQSHIEGVHQMRVALRRMRAMITNYKPYLPLGCFESLSNTLKSVGNRLGPARDIDVFLEDILPKVEHGFEDEAALFVLRKKTEHFRTKAYEDVNALIHSNVYARLLTDILYWVGTSPWIQKTHNSLSIPARDAAQVVLENRHLDLIKQGCTIADMSSNQRHLLRIAIKKMRYVSESFAPLFPHQNTRHYVKHLCQLQDGLGHLNDLSMTQNLMKSLVHGNMRDKTAHKLSRGAGLVEGWYKHAQKSDEQQILSAWSDFSQCKTFWGDFHSQSTHEKSTHAKPTNIQPIHLVSG